MKFKKPRGLLLGLGYGNIVLAVILFFLVPVICGANFTYDATRALGDGIRGLFSNLNFSNSLFTAVFVLFILAVAVVFGITVALIKGKHGSHVVSQIFSMFAIFLSYVLISSYFIGEVELNGTKGQLMDLIIKTNDQMLAKILSSLVIAFAVISNVMLFVHMFADVMSMAVTKEVDDFEKELAGEDYKKEEPTPVASDEVAVKEAPVVSEPAPEAVAVAAVHEETPEEFEARKQRELKLFKECIDSGYFTEYEELELPDAIEGVDEEPVYEASVVEERTAFISKRSVHVGYSHD